MHPETEGGVKFFLDDILVDGKLIHGIGAGVVEGGLTHEPNH